MKGGPEGGGAEPGKPEPWGPQLSQRREGWAGTQEQGTQPQPLLWQGQSPTTHAHPHLTPYARPGARGQKQWLSMGLSAREWLAGQPGVKHWLGLWCRTQRWGMSGLFDGEGGWRSGACCVPLSLHTQAAMPVRAPEGATKGAPAALPHSPIRMNPRLAASPGEITVNSRHPHATEIPRRESGAGWRECGEGKVGTAGTPVSLCWLSCQDVTNLSENKWPNFPENFLWARSSSQHRHTLSHFSSPLP